MKKILSILISVVLGIGSVYAGGTTTNSIKVEPAGAGVASLSGVDYNKDDATKQVLKDYWIYKTYYYPNWNRTIPGTITSPTNNTVYSYGENGEEAYNKSGDKYYHNAEADLKVVSAATNYAFDKWTCSSSFSTAATFTDATALVTTVDYGTNSRGTNGTATVTANFKKIIDPVQSTIDWTKTEETETLQTTVNLFKATNFTIQSVVHSGGLTRDFSCVITTQVDNSAKLTLTAGANVVDGDQFIITLVADNGGYATITVNVKSKITVTFVHPTVGKGSYKAVQTNAGGTESCNISNTDGDKEMNFSLTSQFFHTFTATPHADYNLDRWVITHADNSVEYRKDNPMTYTLQDGDRVTAEFLPKNIAQFVVKGVDGIYYHKLDEAITAAQSASSKTVVVYQSGTLYTEYKTLSADGKYEFTIPSEITLLVPGDAGYTVTKTYTTNEMVENATPTCYKYLTLDPNVRITNNGHICVYAKLSQVQATNGRPVRFGRIDMKDQTELVLNSGSQLTALGYVTGDPSTSRVLAKDGSTVYEAFQFTDWRGGTQILGQLGGIFGGGMLKNKERVFPMVQYYIQSIETKLTLQHGAQEYVSAGVEVSIAGQIPLNMLFISKDTGSDDDNGFICLNAGTEVSKWYDGINDRQIYELNKTEGQTGTPKVKLGVLYTELSGGQELDSKDYVLPINNNMDINLYNVILESKLDLVLMADAQIYVASTAELISKGNLFVYDKEVNDIGFFNHDGQKLLPITYTAYHKGAPNKRTADNVKDARVVIDGKLTVTSGGAHGAGFYTSVENPLANDITYGANITSNGGGLVDFQYLGSTKSYQYKVEEPINIPVSHARLRNGDNSYSAGESMTEPSKYYYYKDEERWLNPKFGITNPTNNEFTVTLPQAKQQDVICKVTTEGMVSDISKSTFTVTLPATSRFTYGDDSHTYTATAEGGELMIPLTYNPVNVDNTGAPYTETMTISYTYYDVIEGQNVTRSTNVTLTANENYSPDFTVTIGGKDVNTDKSYTFEPTDALISLPADVVITPVVNTVATLSATTWNGVAFASPTFTTSGTAPSFMKVIYTPQTEGDDSGTLTITATYVDAAEEAHSKSFVVNLNGTGRLQDNTLRFKQDLIDGYTIDQGLVYENVFANPGNLSEVDFTCTYVGGDVDGQDASALVTFSRVADNYKLKANEIATISEARQIKIVAKQAKNSFMNAGTCEIILTVVPPAIWNWSDLYFGQSYTNPVTSSRLDAWTLTEIDDPNNMVGELQGDYTNYSTVIAHGDVNTVYEARFKFVQGPNQKEFTAKIYADPRVLGYCVDAAHKYKGVTKSATGGVSFDDANDQVSLNANAQWVIQMIGMPDRMTFVSSGENLWNIEQRANGASAWSPVATWTSLGNGTHSFSLLPTTKFVRFTYGSANPESVGQLSDICISKLSVKADVDELYLPINKDGSASSKTFVLTHTDANTPILSEIVGLDYNTSTSNNLGTAEEPYYQTTLTITTLSTFTRGVYNLKATQGAHEEANIPVYADYFPQGLPIKLAEDDVKRYHFVATASDYVSWDATEKEVVLQNPGGSVARSVILAFEGAPSRISFTASRDIVDSEWKIYESVDGTDGSFVESSMDNRDTESGTAFTHNLQYTTRYVRIYYYSENQAELRLSDLVIEGDPMLFVNPEELEFSTDDTEKSLTLTAINLNKIRIELDNSTDFQMSHGTASPSAIYTLSSTDYPNALGKNKVGDIVINTKWITNSIVNDGMITIYNVDDDAVLAKVKLVGAGKYLHKEGANTTGLYTGIPDGTRDTDGDGNPNTEYKYTFHGSDYTEYPYHHVDLSNAFDADGNALFDYIIVYGETTTTDATKNITAPAGENGSNARTPYYVYARDVDAYGNYDRYRHVTMVDNANVGTKAHIPGVTMQEDGKAVFMGVDAGQKMSVYMTGFCPYATTGFTSDQEGAWFFRGKHGSKLDIYLDNCYMFSRNKMETGRPFYTRGDVRNPFFTEDYARGSGGVLVFECVDESADVALAQPFDVTIHTIGKNLLKSNYGSFCRFFGMDPFQISAPIHVRMHSSSHVRKSKTSLTFDDKWPTAMNSTTGEIITTQRTNGFLSLQKMNNNAPSIDLGNPNTVVNFRGGQVELQNAQIVSTNYKTTLAISYRSGEYGGDNVGLKFAAGIGTDSVGGEVNFYDGTVTVLPMWVQEEYKQYYLIDKDANGNEITRTVGGKTEYLTTCLRCPKNTEVYGGSVCWLRACQHVTSKGGAPTFAGKYLGQYIYDIKSGDVVDPNTGLATLISFPEGIVNENNEPLSVFYNTYHPDKKYGVESVSPADKKLYFWIPEGFGGVSAEKDKLISTWKACMTRIEAGYEGKSGGVGGDTPVEPNEEIKYMLYCKIDENMYEVISAGEGDGESRVYTYEAPVKVPSIGQDFVGGEYTTIKPTYIGDDFEHQILSEIPYAITDKVYYVTTATADVWQSFTAPFNVAKIWVVETYDEKTLKKTLKKTDDKGNVLTKHKSIMLEQAKHNADFAAFFGVAMAIGSTDPFETIFNDWKKWGMLKDKETIINGNPLYSGELSGYDLRGRAELIPYMGDNWETAHFYLNENKGNWELDAEADTFKVKWDMLTETDLEDGILLHQGKTYSMLFPYCTGCWNDEAERPSDFWDYWSGKILIFESTDGKVKGEHTIQGTNYIAESKVEAQPWIFDGATSGTDAILTGNSTFATLNTSRDNIYTYSADPAMESFMLYDPEESGAATISPTTSFLYANVPVNDQGMPAKKVTREGKIIYGERDESGTPGDGTTTGTHTPTVGGGNDMFITGIAGGINISVAAPQFVQVVNATGHIIYCGYVANNVDVILPMNGIYVVKGENEAQKIFF